MSSSLFGKDNPSPTQPLTQGPFSQPNNMLQQFMQFKKQMNGQNPKEVVQNLLQSGQMSRQQFEQLSNMANGLNNFLK